MKENLKNCITTYSGTIFDTLDPDIEDIRIEDIAHALSMIARANGHFPEFFSVGQHSLQCANEAIARNYSPEVVMACLVHDGSEAYLSDITRPLKKNLTMYLQIEKQLQDLVYEKFVGAPLDEETEELVKNVDDACLYYEFEHYKGKRIMPTEPILLSEPEYKFRMMKDVEEEFLWMYKQLRNELVHATDI